MAISSITPDESPKHSQLRSALAAQIAGGSLRPGQFLPSEPQLAQQFSLSRSTVRQALASLEDDGLIERLPRRGTVVVGGSTSPTGLATSPTQLAAFALVLPDTQSGHYPALVNSFSGAAADIHRQMLVCTTGNDVRLQGNVILQLLDTGVAGVAILPPTVGKTPDFQLRQLQSTGIPVVLLHRGVESVAAPLIAMPYEEVATKAAEALISQGHRRIAYIANHKSQSSQRYEQALRLSLKKIGAALPESLVHYGTRMTGIPDEAGIREISESLGKLLSLPSDERPTAIFDPWDADMEAVYLCLTQSGVKVPQDISLVSFGGARRGNALASQLSSVTVDETSTAKMAVMLLDEMRRGVRTVSDDSRFNMPIGFFRGETILPR